MSCNPNITVDTLKCFVDCANEPCTVQAYGDIGGIGVILGFIITAWLVVTLIIAYYIMVYDYSLDTFRGKDDFETVTADPNPIDRVFLSTVRKCRFLDYSQVTVKTKRNINRICNQCVVGFADIQIMTGIAILISGIRPTICGLQAYHWQIIVNLAWFSSITHLSALSFLRHYLINCWREYYIREILMAILAGLLAVAVGFTGHFDWDEPSMGKVAPSDFARCVFIGKMETDTITFQSMIVDLLLIGYGYTIRLLKTRKRASNWPVLASKYLMKSSTSTLQDWKPHEGAKTMKGYLLTNFIEPLKIAFLRVIYLQINLFISYLAEVFWLIISCLWRTIRLGRLIWQNRPSLENDWTFGQILPLIMVAAPVILLLGPIASLCRGRLAPKNTGLDENMDLDVPPVETSPATVAPINPQEDQDIADIRNTSSYSPGWREEAPLRSSLHSMDGHVSVCEPRESTPSIRGAEAGRLSVGDASHHDIQPDDENARFLESSPAFQGALFLVAWPYIEFGIYLLIGDTKGVIRPISELAVSLLAFNPLLQTLWLTYTTWASRIPLFSRVPAGLSSLHFTVFLTLVAACPVEFSQTCGSSGSGIGMIIFAYCSLTAWAAFATFSSNGRLPCICCEPLQRNPRWLVSLVLIGVSLHQTIIFQSFYILIPLSVYSLSIFRVDWLKKGPWKFIHSRTGACLVILGAIAAIDIQGWSLSQEERIGIYPFFNPLLDFSLWIFDWGFIISIWPVAWRFGWVHI